MRPEPRHRQLTQARTHRVADHQRAGQHRHGDRHAGDDGEVRAPVVRQAAECKSLQWCVMRRCLSRDECVHDGSCPRPDRPSTAEGRPHRRRQLGIVRDDDQDRLRARVQLEQQRRDASRPSADRGCRSARRTAAAPAGAPARARSPRAASRRPTARPAGDRGAAPSPTRSSSVRARSMSSCVVPVTMRRRQHVLEHRALRQQAVILEDEADARVAERAPARSASACADRRRRASPCRRSADRGRRRCRAACSCRCPTRRRSTPTRRARATARRRAARRADPAASVRLGQRRKPEHGARRAGWTT